jgi:stage II sporulation protein AA (anti-sigma F factor antagonist)
MDTEKPKHFIFDFTDLTYLNSKSIGFIADWQQKIAGNGGKLVIFGVQPNIFDILDVVGLTNLVELVKTMEEAKGKV